MIRETDRYIDHLGGELTQDFQYFRDSAYLYFQDGSATGVYQKIADAKQVSYDAVQIGAGRAAKALWSTGKDILMRDLGKEGMLYPGPIPLARWIAYVVSNGSNLNW